MKEYKFKVVIWEGVCNRREWIMTAPSYGALYNTYIAVLPPGHTGYVLPLD